jgi:hypothetical protein
MMQKKGESTNEMPHTPMFQNSSRVGRRLRVLPH